MACGTKITPRFNTYWERQELAEKLEKEGEYRIARAVARGECLNHTEVRRAENALENQGLHRRFDYREIDCPCDPEEQP